MRTHIFAACAAATLFLGAASPATAAHHKEGKNIVETAVAAGQFETLVAAVKAAGLVDTLSGKGPFTVFAPTDEAFAALPKGTVETLLKPKNKAKLVALLTQHVVSGKVDAKKAMTLDAAPTVEGAKLPIQTKDGKVHVGNATVVKADIMASNGIIHVVDHVIMVDKKKKKSGY